MTALLLVGLVLVVLLVIRRRFYGPRSVSRLPYGKGRL